MPEGFQLRFLTEQIHEALIDETANAEYILAGGRLKITNVALEKATSLQMFQQSGVGLDAFDLEVIKERNIPLYVNQGVSEESVVEHTLLIILSCLRKLPRINEKWNLEETGARGADSRTEWKNEIVSIVFRKIVFPARESFVNCRTKTL